jgi:hypothetical protein
MRVLVYGPQDWADVKDHYIDPSDDWDYCEDREEPIDDDAMQQDYLRAMDEINGLYPQVDHDRRYDDQYSHQHGDIGDSEFPF